MLVSVQVSDPPLPRAPDARYKQRLAGLTVPNCRTGGNQGIKGVWGSSHALSHSIARVREDPCMQPEHVWILGLCVH